LKRLRFRKNLFDKKSTNRQTENFNKHPKQANVKKEDQEITFLSTALLKFGYNYIRQIGQGRFGNVLLIYSEKYRQYFALKQSKNSSTTKFFNEFQLLSQLIHPNIISLYSMIEINSVDCIVLEYCSGGTLNDLIKSYGPIKPLKLYLYCSQILSAVQYLHENNIAHQDIKPSNILLDSHNRIKLADFGFSQHINSNENTIFCGSKLFMAPEIWKFIEGYDPFLADIYSLGVSFYCMSQGKPPFSATHERDLKSLILNGYYSLPTGVDSSFRK
jgi:serine/threonine protein kinase